MKKEISITFKFPKDVNDETIEKIINIEMDIIKKYIEKKNALDEFDINYITDIRDRNTLNNKHFIIEFEHKEKEMD